jgi:hypothetical protein
MIDLTGSIKFFRLISRMGFKIRNLFSYLFAALLYIFINKENTNYIPDIPIKNKFMVINSKNYEEIYSGKWIVFNDCRSLDFINLIHKNDYNFALLKINSFNQKSIK